MQLRVKPNGSKLWLLDYQRPYTKKRPSLSLGSYPIVTLALARSKKNEAKKLLLNNIDPQEHRDDAIRTNEFANTNTLENISAQWLTIKKSTVSAGGFSTNILVLVSFYITNLDYNVNIQKILIE